MFLISGAIGKLFRFSEFCLAVANYEILPKRYISFLSRIFILIEGVAGVLCLSDFTLFYGIFLAMILFIINAVALASALLRGKKNYNCGCYTIFTGKDGDDVIGVRKVFVNIFLLLFCGLVFLLFDGQFVMEYEKSWLIYMISCFTLLAMHSIKQLVENGKNMRF
jgi:hypothetical protein